MNQHDDTKAENSSAEVTGFNPVIIQKDGRFCVHLPEWNVSGEGDTLEQAYQQFQAGKKAMDLRAEKYGLATLSSDPYPALKRKSFYQELALSFMKSAISVFAVVLIVVFLLPNIGAVVSYQIKNVIPTEFRNPKFLTIEFPAKLNAKLDALKPEDVERIRREWGRLFDRLRPMLDGFSKPLPETKDTHPG